MTTIIQSAGSVLPSKSRRQKTLKDRYGTWAVVTGASDGIGRAFAIQLAEAGLDVVLAARRGEVLESLGNELEKRHRIKTLSLAVDLGTREGIETLIAGTAGLDVGLLVACAGFGTSGPLLDSDLETELQMLDVNCRAVVQLSHVFGRRFVARQRGGLVLMSSLVAFQGVPRAAHYSATKAYVQTLAEALRVELGPQGVEVLASAPGPVHSGFSSRASMTMGFAQSPTEVAKATLDALGRTGTVRPGWLAKVLEASLALLPRWGRVRVMGAVMAGMTKR